MDTDDLVQVTVVRALEHVGSFEPRHEGAFLAYLRQILLNQLRDEVRRVARRPARVEVDESLRSSGRSPLEEVIGLDAVERYETALKNLSPEQREAIVLRIEMDFSYQEVAEAMNRPSANAARMLVTRGLVRLAEHMTRAGQEA